MKKVTLTLSGGGLRSAASIGVINYLKENDYKVKAISGTSGGAIISLLYAYGLEQEEMLTFYKSISKWDIFQPTRYSLFSLKKLEEKINLAIKDKELKRELIVCATSFKTGEPKYFSSKNESKEILIKATIASSSLLPFFKPVEINGEYYIDGGYADNLPNIVFKEKQKKGIENVSVNVNNIPKEMSFKLNKVIKRVLLIVMSSNIRESSKRADKYINVDTLTDMNIFDFDKFYNAVDKGHEKAKETFEK